MGISNNFDQRFKPYALTPEQLKVAKQVGRFGTTARGVLFTLVGYFLTLAAYQFNPGHARGFDAAFDFLAKQPYGLWLLEIIAVGMIAFGLYSFERSLVQAEAVAHGNTNVIQPSFGR